MDLVDAPPPYVDASSSSPPSSTSPLLRLPTHVLLQILSHADLPTLVFTLKPTCRALHLSACAVTRSRPSIMKKWESGVRRSAATSSKRRIPSTSISPTHLSDTGQHISREGTRLTRRTREEEVYDVYIASLARYERDKFESYLLLEGGEEVDEREDEGTRSFERDLFGFLQPKARCEDLVIQLGINRGWIEGGLIEGDDACKGQNIESKKVREEDIKVELKSKSAKLLLPVMGNASRPVWRGAIEVVRSDVDTLEELALALSRAFERSRWKRIDDSDGGTVSYHF
ncbi:hypothetical protein JCM16303_002984 [Sporobolomyces ruberrimus]